MSSSTLSAFSKAVAFLPGGANGLGRVTALSIVKHGGKVTVMDTDIDAGRSLVDEIGQSCHFVSGTVSDTDQLKAALREGRTKFGRFNLCVNCASSSNPLKIFNLSKGRASSFQKFWEHMEVNTIGAFNVLTGFVEELESSKASPEEVNNAVVINKTFLYDNLKLLTAFTTSKGAVRSMTLPAARELASLGIRVCSISTGLFKTEWVRDNCSEVMLENLTRTRLHPKFRLAQPEEFCHAVATVFDNPLLNGLDLKLDHVNKFLPE